MGLWSFRAEGKVTAGAATMDGRGLGVRRPKREGGGRGKEEGCTCTMAVPYRSKKCSCILYSLLHCLELFRVRHLSNV